MIATFLACAFYASSERLLQIATSHLSSSKKSLGATCYIVLARSIKPEKTTDIDLRGRWRQNSFRLVQHLRPMSVDPGLHLVSCSHTAKILIRNEAIDTIAAASLTLFPDGIFHLGAYRPDRRREALWKALQKHPLQVWDEPNLTEMVSRARYKSGHPEKVTTPIFIATSKDHDSSYHLLPTRP